MKKKKICGALATLMLLSALSLPVNAEEYSFDGADTGNFGDPTSVVVVVTSDGGRQANEDVSKNAAIIPPSFGSPSSNLPGSGEYLTPDLVASQQAMTSAGINGSAAEPATPGSAVNAPATASGTGTTTQAPTSGYTGTSSVEVVGSQSNVTQFTPVTSDLYYSDGSLGTLAIPTIDVNVRIYQGTDAATLAKGAGHFPDSSIWCGNVGVAGHNRGANCYFGNIHSLRSGDKIILTTKLGTRTYYVTSVEKISERDHSNLAPTCGNCITLYTCVRNESAYRWCVRAVEG